MSDIPALPDYIKQVRYPFDWPITITSPFRERFGHDATDLVPRNLSLVIPMDGEVVFNGWDHYGGGHLLKTKHTWIDNRPIVFWYAHLRERPKLGVGEPVGYNKFFGHVGNSGQVVSIGGDGTHLHFVMEMDGKPVDPLCNLDNVIRVYEVRRWYVRAYQMLLGQTPKEEDLNNFVKNGSNIEQELALINDKLISSGV